MFPDWNSRKRGREDEPDHYEDVSSWTGFSEHRTKRRIAALPHRISPNQFRNPTPPPFAIGTNFPNQPAPPTITPAESESEDTPAEPKSFFSPNSSSPGEPLSQFSSPYIQDPQSAKMSYSDDFDMEEPIHHSPTASQTQYSPCAVGRIPTPIHSAFAPYIRAEKATLTQEDNFADDEALVNRFRRGRRLPSPISEGDMSPSVLADGLEDMQMEVDRSTPTKKGHQRSKHSLRQWSGAGGDLQSAGQGMRRSFSMGYRADCDKCRLQVPGHFSHIITL